VLSPAPCSAASMSRNRLVSFESEGAVRIRFDSA
jgi:hypothetical protein